MCIYQNYLKESWPIAEDIHDNGNQDYLDNYNPNNAGTTPEPEYYTPSAESEKDCKDLPKIIPGASREFYNVNPSTQQEKKPEKKTSPVIAEKETRRSLLEKQAVKKKLRIVFKV